MSYYAFFKGWLLLSQPPGCLSGSTSFSTESVLGTLAGGLGCFPLDDEAYPPPSHWLMESVPSILSLPRFGTALAARTETVLYP